MDLRAQGAQLRLPRQDGQLHRMLLGAPRGIHAEQDVVEAHGEQVDEGARRHHSRRPRLVDRLDARSCPRRSGETGERPAEVGGGHARQHGARRVREEEPGGGGLVDGKGPTEVPDGKEQHGGGEGEGKRDHGRRRRRERVAALREQRHSGQGERARRRYVDAQAPAVGQERVHAQCPITTAPMIACPRTTRRGAPGVAGESILFSKAPISATMRASTVQPAGTLISMPPQKATTSR